MAWNDRTMVLSDHSIREAIAAGRIGIDPFDEQLVQPSSVDVRCDHRFRVFHPGRYPFIDVKQAMPDLTELVEIDDGRAFILHPGEFVLGATLERISLPDDLVARLDGKSSLGRLGLQVHSTAGLADPGFTGQITLELSNMTRLPISLYPGMRVAQLVFEMLSTPADRPYGHGELNSKYQGQSGPTPSQYWRNFDERTDDAPQG
jgi:dCTP deaminase